MGNRERVFVSGMGKKKRAKIERQTRAVRGLTSAFITSFCVPQLSFTTSVSRPCATAVNLLKQLYLHTVDHALMHIPQALFL